jgi:hypothetical protein
MVVTLLCEPRSGSTNLTNWFFYNKNFTTFFEPMNPMSRWFQKNIEPKDYKFKTDHLCLKEIYYPHKKWEEIIQISDKIVILYRENNQEQLESFLNAVITNNWDGEYVYKKHKSDFIEEKTKYFNTLKAEFKEKYIDKGYFKVSYEELYYSNGFQRIVDYLNLNCIKNENFPHGQKYRINSIPDKLI